MLAYLAEGLSAAEVARAALGGDASPTVGGLASPPAAAPAGSEPFAELSRALDAFDEPTAQAVLDGLMAELSLPAVLREVVLPYLADLGERWQRGTASIAAAPARASAVVWSQHQVGIQGREQLAVSCDGFPLQRDMGAAICFRQGFQADPGQPPGLPAVPGR